ncbi:hypothetical protein GUJ93_ZPchr0458g22674 [Zizania palustris]|uniref:DNA-directed RNA polymerase n=1 Tax=Zizania palustris TaxID=103762 RepID=A0A8J5RS97_ZIZPA|nr:hypothetical protein GUJ93_ZPchr0458g22674 [Zizania palustris]
MVLVCCNICRVIVGCACAMEEPPKDNGQSPRGSDPELEPMMLEDDGEGKSHTMDDANGHSSMDVDRGYHSMDIIGSSLDDDGKGKHDSYAHVSIDMSIPSIEKFCKEASRSFFDEISLISHQIILIMSLSLMGFKVYSMEKSEKAKTGNDHFGYKKNITNETHIINIGRLPVMVKSNLCWLHKLKESDCQFDLGGYFLIKGMEKVFIAQEQRCLTRIWVDDRPCLTVSFLSEIRRRRISSDKAVFDMIDMQDCDACVINTITTTIKESDELCEGFRKTDKARQYVDELIKNSKFPPAESFDDYIDKYMFPSITGKRNKALFLGYMVKCLLMAFTGKRKCDNRDDFRNKRLELAGQLLAREFRAHIRHAERLMVKALQRDLNTDRDFHDLDRYLDASIITNGLNRAFSTGSWCHPYKRNERCSGIVATLRRTNPLQMTSDLRKTRQQVAYAGKAGDARYPNPSYWGKLCFMSTPDGENCGLVKNLAVTAIVSSRVDQPLIDSFISCGMIKLHEIPTDEVPRMDKIFLNGDWVGSCTDPASFVLRLRCMRRSGLINSQSGDIIIGKVSESGEDHSIKLKHTEKGQLLEAALGKGIALGATMRYATPFTTASVDVISDQLHKFGFSRWGAESVLNGRTGERMNSLIFMGPTFYQRLIHMAEDKVKFRNTGPVHPLTRQPVADRKRFGGVKFGEMERDCLLAHGAAANLHERLFMLSDFSQMHICQTCERAANVVMRPVPGGKKIRGPYCGFCRSSENIVRINVPYGAKLLYQELFSMGICLKFETEVC